jgi:hypothetical protein
MPHTIPNRPIVQKSAPQRHDITDPRIQAKAVSAITADVPLTAPAHTRIASSTASLRSDRDQYTVPPCSVPDIVLVPLPLSAGCIGCVRDRVDDFTCLDTDE